MNINLEEGQYSCYDKDNKNLLTISLKNTKNNIILYDCLGNGFFKPVDIEECFFKDKTKCSLRKDNKSKHCIRIWSEKDFTVYFNRNGVPYYFKKIEKTPIDKEIKLLNDCIEVLEKESYTYLARDLKFYLENKKMFDLIYNKSKEW